MAKRTSPRAYPADWKGSRWVCFYPDKDMFPRLPACYVIYLDGALSYIGQASDLAVRMSSHGIRITYGNNYATKWGHFKSVVVKARFSSRLGDWAMREIRLINRIQPPLNCVGSSRKRVACNG